MSDISNLYITKTFNENLLINIKKYFMVIYENTKDKKTAEIAKKLISNDCWNISLRFRKLAPAKAGIDKKKAILLDSTLLKPKNLAAVNVIPALLTPGINAKI